MIARLALIFQSVRVETKYEIQLITGKTSVSDMTVTLACENLINESVICRGMMAWWFRLCWLMSGMWSRCDGKEEGA